MSGVQIGRQAGGQTSKHTGRELAGRQTDIQADRQVSKTYRQAGGK
jgi:hypothetical protein